MKLLSRKTKRTNKETKKMETPKTTPSGKPLYVSAHFFKVTTDEELGVQVEEDDYGRLRIAKIDPNSPASKSPLRKGLQVTFVGGDENPLGLMDARKTNKFLRGASGSINVIAKHSHDETRDPYMTKSWVTKRKFDQTLGLELERHSCGLLLVAHVDEDKMFGESEVAEGDLLLAVNGASCKNMAPEEAISLMTKGGDSVTVIVRSEASVRQPQILSRKGVYVADSCCGPFCGVLDAFARRPHQSPGVDHRSPEVEQRWRYGGQYKSTAPRLERGSIVVHTEPYHYD